MKSAIRQKTRALKIHHLAFLCLALVFAPQQMLAKKGGNGGGPGGGNEEPPPPINPAIAARYYSQKAGSQIILMNADGTNRNVLLESNLNIDNLCFSPTSNVLYYTTGGNTIYRHPYEIDTANNAIVVNEQDVVVLNQGEGSVMGMDVSPDGEWIIWNAPLNGNEATLRIIPTDGSGSEVIIWEASKTSGGDLGTFYRFSADELTWISGSAGDDKLAFNLVRESGDSDSLLVVVPINTAAYYDSSQSFLDWNNKETLDTYNDAGDHTYIIRDGFHTGGGEAILLERLDRIEETKGKGRTTVTLMKSSEIWTPGVGVTEFLPNVDLIGLNIGLRAFSPAPDREFIVGSGSSGQSDIVIVDVVNQTTTTIGTGSAWDWKADWQPDTN